MLRGVAWVALLAFGGAGLPGGIAAQDPHPAAGRWEGVLDAGGTRLRIVFNIEADDDGVLTGTMDSPDQGAFGIPLSSVTADGSTVTFAVAAIGGAYDGTVSDAGSEISGTWSQGGASLPMSLTRSEGEPAPPPRRPQEPEEPLPYDVEDVTFANGDARIALAGTLTIPRGPGPHPGAVLVSGSGPQDRDEALAGHKPFLVLADHLTRNGIAVLRYDDRGVGESEGDFQSATSEDFAGDALAAVAHLRALPSVADDGVGIVGHSEGGLIGPMAANRSGAVAYVVMLAGPGVPGIDILIEQGRLINQAMGTPPVITEMNMALQRRLADIVAEEPDPEAAATRMRAAFVELVETLPANIREAAGEQLGEAAIEQTVTQMNSNWFRFFLPHDPRTDLERVDVPVLALFGERDLQVPYAQNQPEVEAAFARSGNADATVRVLPGLNHLFQEATTGTPMEYQQIEQTMSPTLLHAVSDWIVERFGS